MNDDKDTTAPRRRTSRRKFLALAGGSAAAAAAAGAGGVPDAAGAESTTVPSGSDQPLVAYVSDAHSGDVVVMAGERETVVHDRELAARIARAAL